MEAMERVRVDDQHRLNHTSPSSRVAQHTLSTLMDHFLHTDCAQELAQRILDRGRIHEGLIAAEAIVYHGGQGTAITPALKQRSLGVLERHLTHGNAPNSLVERCRDSYLRQVGLEAGRALLDAWLLRVGDLGRNGGPVASVLFTLCAQQVYTPSPKSGEMCLNMMYSSTRRESALWRA